jgi:predicted dehydrogenase
VTIQNTRDYESVNLDGASITASDAAGEIMVTLRALTNSAGSYELTVFGTEGIMTIDLRHTPGIYVNQTVGFSPKTVLQNFVVDGFQLVQNFVNLIVSKVSESISDNEGAEQQHSGHYRIIDQFIDAAKHGTDVPVSLEQGLDTIRIVEELASASKANLGE